MELTRRLAFHVFVYVCVCFGGVQHKRLKDRNSYLVRKFREHGFEEFRDDWGRIDQKFIWRATVRAVCRIAEKRFEKKTSMDALRVVLHEEETKEMKAMDKMEIEVRAVE